jgi:signal transduction histidine kinase
MDFRSLLNWFAGGTTPYRTLFQSMSRDWTWISVTVTLDLAVATGCSLIALHWWKNQKGMSPGPAHRALGHMRNIFVFCGICGYLFIPVKMFWPAWRLYDMIVAVLAFYTWRYAWGARDLRVVYNELRRSNQLAEDLEASQAEGKRKSFFLNAVGHDLRTPLNSVMLQSQWAEMSLAEGDPEAVKESLAEIQASARAAANLLNNILELGRSDGSKDSHRVSLLDLSESLSSLVQRFQTLARDKGLALDWDAPRGLLIRTDRFQFEPILANLIDNAIKYTPEGSVRVEASVSGSKLSVSVVDTGLGIDPADQALVFDEFFQVHNGERDRSKGFGLGLAIAIRLARQLGGEIRLRSSVGRGSQFTLSLPDAVPSGASCVQSQNQPGVVEPLPAASPLG